MPKDANRTLLPLASSPAGCSCSADAAAAPAGNHADSPAVEFAVEGLTCGHCVQTVEKAVAAVTGVATAVVELVPGGRSRLLIEGTADAAAVREAVTSAGYTLSR